MPLSSAACSSKNNAFSDGKISDAQISGTMAPNIRRYSVSNYLHVTLLAHRTQRWFPEFLENLWIPGLILNMVISSFKMLQLTIQHSTTSEDTHRKQIFSTVQLVEQQDTGRQNVGKAAVSSFTQNVQKNLLIYKVFAGDQLQISKTVNNKITTMWAWLYI